MQQRREEFRPAKVYLPAALHRQIRLIAAAEGISQSRVMATILRAFFQGVPVRFEDETAALVDAFHRADTAAPPQPQPQPQPVADPLSRVNLQHPASPGLSSRPDPEDNGPSLTEMVRNRSPKR